MNAANITTIMLTPFKIETKTTLVNIIGGEAYFSDYSGIRIAKLEDYIRGPIAEHKFRYIKLFCADETPADYARREDPSIVSQSILAALTKFKIKNLPNPHWCLTRAQNMRIFEIEKFGDVLFCQIELNSCQPNRVAMGEKVLIAGDKCYLFNRYAKIAHWYYSDGGQVIYLADDTRIFKLQIGVEISYIADVYNGGKIINSYFENGRIHCIIVKKSATYFKKIYDLGLDHIKTYQLKNESNYANKLIEINLPNMYSIENTCGKDMRRRESNNNNVFRVENPRVILIKSDLPKNNIVTTTAVQYNKNMTVQIYCRERWQKIYEFAIKLPAFGELSRGFAYKIKHLYLRAGIAVVSCTGVEDAAEKFRDIYCHYGWIGGERIDFMCTLQLPRNDTFYISQCYLTRRERKLARFILFCLRCVGLPRDIARAICIAAF